jgi:hypothetical protein
MRLVASPDALRVCKRTASDSVATFIDRILAEGILSDDNVDKYVEQVLNNEELDNSAVNFIVAKDLDKYVSVKRWQTALRSIRLLTA